MTSYLRFHKALGTVVVASFLVVSNAVGQKEVHSGDRGSDGVAASTQEPDREQAIEKLRQKINEQVLSCAETMEPLLGEDQFPEFLKIATAHFVGEMKYKMRIQSLRSDKNAKSKSAISAVNEQRRKLRVQTEKAAKKTLGKEQLLVFKKVLDDLTPLPPEPRRSAGGGGGGGDFGGGGGDSGVGGFGGGDDF